MSLIINQGKQDTSKDMTFEVMVSPNEIAQITAIELDKEWEKTIKVTFKIIGESKYKGRLFWDRISFDPANQFSWKYRNVRRAAGVPYVEGESPQIDIEALLLNKAVTVELAVRKGNDGNDYQGVKYKTNNTKTEKPSAPAVAPVQTPVAPNADDINPFDTTDDISTDVDVPW
jgi:hypothetical protein